MQQSEGDHGAEGCRKWALAEVAKIEKQLSDLQQKNSAEMLCHDSRERVERLSLISQAKSLEETIARRDRKVINTHNERAVSILWNGGGKPNNLRWCRARSQVPNC